MATVDNLVFSDRADAIFQGARLQANGQQANKRPQPKYWLNVGITTQATNPTTGEVEELFISLPFGLGLDTMSLADIKGSEFKREIARSKNRLLHKFRDIAEKLAPGEEIDLGKTEGGLSLRLKRIMEETEESAERAFNVDFTW